MERINQPKGAHQHHLGTEHVFGPDDLTLDTGGQLQPVYELLPRRAGALAVSELAVEQFLGPVRVAALRRVGERPGTRHIQIAWRDDHGPSRAAGQYSVDQVFSVRLPGAADRFSIGQSLDRAARRNRDIPEDTARLIAAHLHIGPHSTLYDFAVDGAIRDRLFDELDDISRNRPYVRSWVQALARYCLGREDLGPLPGWRATRGAAWAEHRKITAGQDLVQITGSAGASNTNGGPLDQEYLRADLAAQLIDQAFMIGTAATRMDVFASGSLVKVLHRMKNAA